MNISTKLLNVILITFAAYLFKKWRKYLSLNKIFQFEYGNEIQFLINNKI